MYWLALSLRTFCGGSTGRGTELSASEICPRNFAGNRSWIRFAVAWLPQAFEHAQDKSEQPSAVGVRGGSRDSDFEFSARAVLAGDFELAAYAQGTLPHAYHAPVAVRCSVPQYIRHDAAAVVPAMKAEAFRSIYEVQNDVGCASVTDRVGECFTPDPSKARRVRLREVISLLR